jgi:hypothetical protein
MNSILTSLLGALVGVSIAGVYVISKGLDKMNDKLSEIILLLKK